MTKHAQILAVGCLLIGLVAHGCTCSRHEQPPPAPAEDANPPPAEILQPPNPEENIPPDMEGAPTDSDSDSDSDGSDWGTDSNQDPD